MAQVIFAVAGVMFIVTLLTLWVSRLYTPNDNLSTLIQVRSYIDALEIEYRSSNSAYPAPLGDNGLARTTLDQYGCLAPTIGFDSCLFDGREIPMFPDSKGLEKLDIIEYLRPLEVPVSDRDGDEFDSITYSSNGTKFRLRWPMAGDGVECGIRNSYEVFAESPNFAGVTICMYESR